MIITIDGLAMKKKEDVYQNIKEELDVPEHCNILLQTVIWHIFIIICCSVEKFLHYNMMQSQLGRSFCQQLLKVLQDADILTIIDEH